MAITSIIGFQPYRSINAQFTDFSRFGKLPFEPNEYESESSRFVFSQWGGRTWLRFITSNSYYSYSHRYGYYYYWAPQMPSLSFLFKDVFKEKYNDGNRFLMGVRFFVETGSGDIPNDLIFLTIFSKDINTGGHSILTNDLITENTEQYFEFEFDFSTALVRRWRDGERLEDLSLDFLTTAPKDRIRLHIGQRKSGNYTSASSISDRDHNRFQVTDFYFIADTQDDTPCDRLGPVEIEALEPDSIELGEDWSKVNWSEPSLDLLKQIPPSVNMRDSAALLSDPAGSRSTVGFKQPDYVEGEILYTELDVYAYRGQGDTVDLNTQVHQGEGDQPALRFPLEVEKLKTGSEALFPARLHKPLDGSSVWTVEKLGQISLDLFTNRTVTDE